MSIIKRYNKANNTVYVYESESYWDKENQKSRSKRKLIGKVDPVTGEIVPTGKPGRKRKEDTIDTAEETVELIKKGKELNERRREKVLEKTTDYTVSGGEAASQKEPDYREMYERCSAELKICKARLDGKDEVIADFQRRITEAEREIKKLRSAIKKAQKILTQAGEKMLDWNAYKADGETDSEKKYFTDSIAVYVQRKDQDTLLNGKQLNLSQKQDEPSSDTDTEDNAPTPDEKKP